MANSDKILLTKPSKIYLKSQHRRIDMALIICTIRGRWKKFLEHSKLWYTLEY